MIRVPEVRVIDAEGEQLGIMATDKALALAEEQGLDLVEVSPTARPPVCRIMDYGKYKYELNKKQKESKKKQHTVQVKEVKFRPKTEEHDYQFKKRHAEEFLSKGHKVKITMMFRGRELDHRELGMKMLGRLEEDLAEVGTVERAAKFEGRLITMFMAPLAGRPKPKATQPRESAANPENLENPEDEQQNVEAADPPAAAEPAGEDDKDAKNEDQ
jgi:translation initiation factor IF-3